MKLFLYFCLPLIFFFFFCVPLQQRLCRAATLTNETDKLALIAFKKGMTEQVLNSWNDSLPFCEWGGVTCSSRKRVIVLDLDSQGLKGSVSPFLGNLSFLTSVSLRNNSLNGQIPQEIGRLSRLQYLKLNNNSFSGQIPLNLSRCSSLVFLTLGYNNFEGNIPAELGSLSRLVNLSLTNNKLNGLIPASLGNLSFLENFYLNANSLQGSIPDSFGRLRSVIRLFLGDNLLFGTIPPSLYNLSSLQVIYLGNNQHQGNLPHDLGYNLPNLRNFLVSNNSFSGPIPVSLFKNVSVLEIVDLGFNIFTGKVPTEVGSQMDLVVLQLAENNLGIGKDDDLDFITSLTNCSQLRLLDIGVNRFRDTLPVSIANLSTTLISLYLGDNQISGTIPPQIGSLAGLSILSAEFNFLTGSIPDGIGRLQNLQTLTLNGNRFSGRIPYFLGNLSRLGNLDLSNNFLEGATLPSFENCQFLQILNLSYNNLSGTIPKEVVGLSRQLRLIILARNSFTGPLPLEAGNLKALQLLDVSENKITGEIPSTLGSCLSLEYVYLQDNLLQGSIPLSFASLKGIQELNLSRNNLSGVIPRDLEDLSLTSLGLAYNKFEGDVPRKGIFRNGTAFSIVGNDKLCGGIPELHLVNCYTRKSKRGLPLILKVILGILLPLLVGLIIALYWKRKARRELPSTRYPQSGLTRVSYNDLHKATNGFSSENLIGMGSYGTVYKGVLDQDQGPIAVKVLNLTEQGGYKSFMAECGILRQVRHRHLLKILTVCSTQDFKRNDFKALVFEFMPNGSLEDWLHPSSDISNSLDLLQRLNIAIDIASALDYLHNFSETPIVHCDLKPSNVLLDHDMVAYVSDFGLAKFLPKTTSSSTSSGMDSIAVRGTIGYIPPEYGIGDKVSKQGDMYSYGILLLEMFTGKRPTDKMFEDGLSLHTHCEAYLTTAVMDIVDLHLLSEEIPNEALNDTEEQGLASTQKKECLMSIIRIGVQCSSESTGERMEIKVVLTELNAIKRNLLKGIREDSENPDF